jgi:hypothetical protein
MTSWLEKAQQTQPSVTAASKSAMHLRTWAAEKFRPEQVEGVAHVQLVAAAGIGRHRLQRALAVADLTDRRALAIFVEQRAESA